jgi:hypothetical protein
MTYVIHCITPLENRRRVLRTGERLRVGTSEWMDWRLPASSELAAEHFEVIYQTDLSVSPLSGSISMIDGTPIESSVALSASEMLAGPCKFFFEATFPDGALATPPVDGPSSMTSPRCMWPEKQRDIDLGKLSLPAATAIQSCETPKVAVAKLVEQSLYEDAMRLIAATLDAREAVSWCLNCLRNASLVASSGDSECIMRLVAWQKEPTESMRLQVANAIDWKNSSSPWTWLQAAVAWTGGSLAPVDVAVVPPPRGMVVSALIATMQLASCQTDLQRFRKQACKLGQFILQAQLERE